MLSLMLSLNDVEEMYINGRATREEVEEYIKKWNEGNHFTIAILRDGKIRNVLREGD